MGKTILYIALVVLSPVVLNEAFVVAFKFGGPAKCVEASVNNAVPLGATEDVYLAALKRRFGATISSEYGDGEKVVVREVRGTMYNVTKTYKVRFAKYRSVLNLYLGTTVILTVFVGDKHDVVAISAESELEGL